MKGKVGFVLFVVWTCVSLVWPYAVAHQILDADKVLIGNGVTTETASDFELSGEEITLTAASPWFFLVRNLDTGSVIQGVEVEKPLGWEHDKYYIYGSSPENVDSGRWHFYEGSATIVAESMEADGVTLKVIREVTLGDWFLLYLLGVAIWWFVCYLVTSISDW